MTYAELGVGAVHHVDAVSIGVSPALDDACGIRVASGHIFADRLTWIARTVGSGEGAAAIGAFMGEELPLGHVLCVNLCRDQELGVELEIADSAPPAVDAAVLRLRTLEIGLLQNPGDFGAIRDLDARTFDAGRADIAGVSALTAMLSSLIGVDASTATGLSAPEAFAGATLAGLSSDRTAIVAGSAVLHGGEHAHASPVADGFFFDRTRELRLSFCVFFFLHLRVGFNARVGVFAFGVRGFGV